MDDPKSVRAWIYNHRAQYGHYLAAEADYEKSFAVQTPPRLTDPLFSLGQMHEQKKDYAAIRDYERILDVNGHDYDDDVAETGRIREKLARLRKQAGEG